MVKRYSLARALAVINSIQNSEAIIAVVDAADNPRDALAMFQPGSNWSGPPMAVLLNKTDVLSPEAVTELADWYKEACRWAVGLGAAACEGQPLVCTNDCLLKREAVRCFPSGRRLCSRAARSRAREWSSSRRGQ
jgi:hypothetical protein